MSASRVRIAVSEDRLEVRAIVEPGETAIDRSEIDALLMERQVVRTHILDDEILRCVVESDGNEEIVRVVVARGRSPRRPVDSTFELEEHIAETLKLPSQRVAGHDGDMDEIAQDGEASPAVPPEGPPIPTEASEATDHYALTAFCVVDEGDLLGRIIPARPGEDGEDVFGETIPVPDPRPVAVKFEQATTRIREDRVMARVAGHVECTAVALRVRQDLDIQGYVDFSTGNIKFPGDVRIFKGVRDCFLVEVGGSLRVGEMVEAAQLRTRRDCTLERGMAAREKGRLDVGRDLQSRYLENVDVRVGRDASIDKEVNNCAMEVYRHFKSPQCTIMAGALRVTGQCEVAQLGSESGAPTEIVVGKILEVESLVSTAVQLLGEITDRRTKVLQKLTQIQGAVGRLNEAAAEELTLLQLELGQWTTAQRNLCDRIDALLSMPACNEPSWLHVHRMIYHKVQIWIGPYKATFTEDVRGPVRIEMEGSTPMVRDVQAETSIELQRVSKMHTDERYVDLSGVREQVASIRGEFDARCAA
ncbi:MAG: DUF342 domain-containing protein [Phycisphaerales bacterium]|nr:DUF342 domain-containing protein [Phycisphaerales bacterium]